TSAATMLHQVIGQAKKLPSLIPLFIFIGAGGTGAALYVLCLVLFNPDVSWDRKNNPEPWNKLVNQPMLYHKGHTVEVHKRCWSWGTLMGRGQKRPHEGGDR
uniref:Cytochrome c oxidase subunit NDUFA4 n=1 Tax=Canis lupus dingo TaxID=286419 RepID=A0A8C0R1P0_CANLU